jgi:hypothetical protein
MGELSRTVGENWKNPALDSILFDTLSIELDQEFGIFGREIELEDRLLDQRTYRLARVILKVCGQPSDRTSQIFPFRQQIAHGSSPFTVTS